MGGKNRPADEIVFRIFLRSKACQEMNTVAWSCLIQGTASLGTGRARNGSLSSSRPVSRVAWVTTRQVGGNPVARHVLPLLAVVPSRHVNKRVHRLPRLATCAKRKEDVDPLADREAALQRREAELWERQGDMYERALEELKEFKSIYGEERRGWMARELALVKENNELRSKLMYLVSRMGAVDRGLVDADWIDGTPASGEIPDVVSSREEEEEVGEEMVTRPARQDGRAQAPAENSIAADFAAAFAAVEEGDVLKDDLFARNGDVPSESPQSEFAQAVRETASIPTRRAKEENDTGKTDEIVGDRVGARTLQEQELDDAPQEVPTGPPPSLTVGDDDIYWMNQLHVALVDEGYFPGDEDIEDFFFGTQTQSALLTFQACCGLEETGCTDEATWKALLGDELKHKKSRDLTEDMNPLTEKTEGPEGDSSSTSGASKSKPFAELFSAETYEVQRSGDKKETTTYVHDEKYFADGHVEVTDETVISSSSTTQRTTWPTVLEGEGGQVVHALHVLLSDAGFYPNDDELQWWQFGDSTVTAIKTFQACNGLAETGTVNERLWKMLAGDDAHPSMVDTLKSGKSDDEDLSLEGREGMVWLIGEQRWEDRRKLK